MLRPSTALLVLTLAASCKEPGEVMTPTTTPRVRTGVPAETGPRDDRKPAPTTTTGDRPQSDDARPATETPEGGAIGEKVDAADIAATQIDFPVLSLHGTGTTDCKQQLATDTRIETSLDAAQLTVDYKDARVQCFQGGFLGFGSCNQAEFDQQVRSQIVGATRYVRATAAELRTLKESGFNAAPYAIFAKGVTTNQGVTYTFDKPLPVFPWPAPATRYDELTKGPQTWSAQATGGGRTVTVAVSVAKASQSGDEVQLVFAATINGSADPVLYDKFPIPRQATYRINTVAKDVRSIQALNWFVDKQCQGGGQVALEYKLCRKVRAGKTEDFPCG